MKYKRDRLRPRSRSLLLFAFLRRTSVGRCLVRLLVSGVSGLVVARSFVGIARSERRVDLCRAQRGQMLIRLDDDAAHQFEVAAFCSRRLEDRQRCGVVRLLQVTFDHQAQRERAERRRVAVRVVDDARRVAVVVGDDIGRVGVVVGDDARRVGVVGGDDTGCVGVVVVDDRGLAAVDFVVDVRRVRVVVVDDGLSRVAQVGGDGRRRRGDGVARFVGAIIDLRAEARDDAVAFGVDVVDDVRIGVADLIPGRLEVVQDLLVITVEGVLER